MSNDETKSRSPHRFLPAAGDAALISGSPDDPTTRRSDPVRRTNRSTRPPFAEPLDGDGDLEAGSGTPSHDVGHERPVTPDQVREVGGREPGGLEAVSQPLVRRLHTATMHYQEEPSKRERASQLRSGAVRHTRMTDSESERLFRRYAWLVHQLGNELGNVRGWIRRAAERLGVHESYVSKIIRGQVETVGADAIEKAIERLHLRREFFYDATLEIPDGASWREYAAPTVRWQDTTAEALGGVEALGGFTHLRWWTSLRSAAYRLRQSVIDHEIDEQFAIDFARAVLANPTAQLARDLQAEAEGRVLFDVYAKWLAEDVLILAEASQMVAEKYAHRLVAREVPIERGEPREVPIERGEPREVPIERGEPREVPPRKPKSRPSDSKNRKGSS